MRQEDATLRAFVSACCQRYFCHSAAPTWWGQVDTNFLDGVEILNSAESFDRNRVNSENVASDWEGGVAEGRWTSGEGVRGEGAGGAS